MSRCQHGSSWPSLDSRLYLPLFPGGLQGYILYRHKVVVYRFLLVVLPLPVLCEGVHRSISLLSSSLLIQQCPASLVRLTWIVVMIGGKWPYSCYFVGCCLRDSLNIACSILVGLPSGFFSIRLFSVHVVHPYSSLDTTATWNKTVFYFNG